MPARYELRLEPFLDKATFEGRETIYLNVLEPTDTVVLNASDLIIESATFDNNQGAHEEASILTDDQLQRCTFTLSKPLTRGQWRLHLSFKGTLNDKLRGFYRSTYADQTGTTHTLAATQFEATDARRAFPCWDEPDFKPSSRSPS